MKRALLAGKSRRRETDKKIASVFGCHLVVESELLELKQLGRTSSRKFTVFCRDG